MQTATNRDVPVEIPIIPHGKTMGYIYTSLYMEFYRLHTEVLNELRARIRTKQRIRPIPSTSILRYNARIVQAMFGARLSRRQCQRIAVEQTHFFNAKISKIMQGRVILPDALQRQCRVVGRKAYYVEVKHSDVR